MAMDTLATQAHGAGNLPLVGEIAQRAFWIACVMSIPHRLGSILHSILPMSSHIFLLQRSELLFPE